MVPSSSLTQFDRDATMLRRSFGVDFLLDGNIHQLGSRTRASVWLMDLRDENRIAWSQRFDWTSSDILTLQDDMVAEIAAQLGPEIQMAESRRVAQQGGRAPHRLRFGVAGPAADGTAAAGRVQPGRVAVERGADAGSGLRARACQPGLPPELPGGAGLGERRGEGGGRCGPPCQPRHRTDPASARAFAVAGHVRAFMDKRPREALELHARALSLNPNLPMAWGFSAATYTYLGELDEAARRFAATSGYRRTTRIRFCSTQR